MLVTLNYFVTMATYHITNNNNGSKKLVSVQSKSINALRDEIRSRFQVMPFAVIVQKAYDDDWLDVETDEDFQMGES